MMNLLGALALAGASALDYFLRVALTLTTKAQGKPFSGLAIRADIDEHTATSEVKWPTAVSMYPCKHNYPTVLELVP